MKNKNILELCLSPGFGGLEMFSLSCYKSFSSKAQCKIVVAPGQKLDQLLGDIQDKHLIKRNKLFPFVPAIQLAKYIDVNDIDIVHFHWTRDMMTAVLAKLFSKRKPKLIQSRHMGMTRFKDDIYHRWLYGNIDMIHAVTYRVKEQLEKYIPLDVSPKIEMVYLGAEVAKIDENIVMELKKKYKANGEFIVGMLGRIEEAKGQFKVIQAISSLRDLNIKALIVGSATQESYLQSLQKKVQELGLENKVLFTGFTKNVNEYMQIFDVNVLATENETFGLVVIEAMVNKVPMIATNKGGPLEIIEDEIDGLFFDGSVKDLTDKINLLYCDEILKNKIALGGFETVMKKFDKTKQLKSLKTIIEKI